MKTLWSRNKTKGWLFLELDKQKMAMRHHYPEQKKFHPEIEHVRIEHGLYFVSISFQKRDTNINVKVPRTMRVDVYDQRGVLLVFDCRNLKEAKEWVQSQKGKKLQTFVSLIHPYFTFENREKNGRFSYLRFGSKKVLTWEEVETNDLYTLMVRVMSYNPIEIHKYHKGE